MSFPAKKEPLFPIKASAEEYGEDEIADALNLLKQATTGMISNLMNEDIIALQRMGLLDCSDYVKALAEFKYLDFLLHYGPHKHAYFHANGAHRSQEVKDQRGNPIFPDGKISQKVLDIVDVSNQAILTKLNEEGTYEELSLRLEEAGEKRDDARDELHMQCIDLTHERQDPATALLNRAYAFLEHSFEVEEEMVSKIIDTPPESSERLSPPPKKGKET